MDEWLYNYFTCYVWWFLFGWWVSYFWNRWWFGPPASSKPPDAGRSG